MSAARDNAAIAIAIERDNHFVKILGTTPQSVDDDHRDFAAFVRCSWRHKGQFAHELRLVLWFGLLGRRIGRANGSHILMRGMFCNASRHI